MSTLEVNAIRPRTGTDIDLAGSVTIGSGNSITGTTSQFKITGGSAGQAILTDGSGNISFGDVDALPTQSGQTGKFLTTDGTNASWVDESTINTSHTKKALIYAIIFGG